MDEAWYIVEYQIRERLTGAREAARIRALTHDRTSTPRRMSSVRTTIIRLAKWALGWRNVRASGALTDAGQLRPATNRCESEREQGHHDALVAYPNADFTRPST
jgi:hypothetical protein